MNVLDDRLPIVEEPATGQVEELHKVCLGLGKGQVERVDGDHQASFDELRTLKPIT
ncbi:hypothetical protein [Paraburkholderia sacchari]|uniref:Uncharacterized protein n=1 Tax=Paraburkholderia sacchari TaxID=159450 RepID=A0A8T6Z8I9_9BURK|nr:hypothetical protein [Paraburkholderia sacchari]NLP60524.1 hypothetical protein [Paraburkholderia sacchari]